MSDFDQCIEEHLDPKLVDTFVQMPKAPTAPDQFRVALTKLAQDSAYRQKAIENPAMIVTDFKLSLKELSALRSVAAMSGADVSAVDSLSAAAAATRAAKKVKWDIDISCCSCCCCCCGETAAVSVGM